MPIGKWQLSQKPNLNDWVADTYYAVILGDEVTMTDAVALRSEIVGSSNIKVDAISVNTKTINASGGAYQYRHADIDYGSSLSVTGAKYAAVLKGNPAAVAGTDSIVAWVVLDTSGGLVSATSLIIRADATNGIAVVTQSN